jgi:hypothetical protein
MIRWLVAAVALLTACGSPEKIPLPPAADAGELARSSGPTTVPACDDYYQKYLACIEKMPEARRAEVRADFEKSLRRWKLGATADEEARRGLEAQCKEFVLYTKKATARIGCEW